MITTTIMRHGAIPVTLENDQQAISTALTSCNKIAPHQARIVRIKNTAELDKISISEPLLEEAKQNDNIEILTDPSPMKFDGEGNIEGLD